jgi:tripartite-type tricarboxylate transporter receptor subunit TctC
MPGKERYTKSGAPLSLRFLLYALLCSIAVGTPAVAQHDQGNFYRGRTITVYIGYSPGGGYDTYSRMIAQYIGRHIPGAPAVIVQNMPGGGSRVVSAYMANIAPKDGTALASADQSLALQQALGEETIKFDNRRFNWIGNPDQDNNTVVT